MVAALNKVNPTPKILYIFRVYLTLQLMVASSYKISLYYIWKRPKNVVNESVNVKNI